MVSDSPAFQFAFFIVETMYVITYALSVLEENTPAFYILYWLVAVIGAGEDGFIIEDVCFDIDVSGSIFIPLALGGRDSYLKVIYNGDVIPEQFIYLPNAFPSIILNIYLISYTSCFISKNPANGRPFPLLIFMAISHSYSEHSL